MKRQAILIVILTISLSTRLKAEDPVFFTDSQLELAVESLLGQDPTPTDMLDLTFLDANSCDIYHLGGLEHALNLTYLDVSYNSVFDLSPISGLVNLKWLYLEDNLISDISELSGLTDLEILYLYNNQVNDISALAALENLTELDLDDNQVGDISALGVLTGLEYLWLYNNQVDNITVLAPLFNLIGLDIGSNQISDISAIELCTHLDILYLDQNPLNTPAYCTYLPFIETNNPLTTMFSYDPNPNPFTSDCSTDMTELEQWSSHWLDTGCSPSNDFCSHTDLDHINDVNLNDFALFTQLWLRENQ